MSIEHPRKPSRHPSVLEARRWVADELTLYELVSVSIVRQQRELLSRGRTPCVEG